MIDLRRLRVDTEAVVAAMARRGVARAELDAVLALDAQARELGARRDAIRTEIKELSRQVGAARRDGDADAAEQAARRSRELGTEESSLAHQADELAQQVRERLLRLPNLPAPDAPAGASEHDNVVARTWGSITEYQDHQGVPHWEIGAELGILDLERGAKISGSMFPMYRGEGAALVRALVSFALDLNRDAFEEIRPPTLVRTDTMIATGHLPKFEEEAYAIERDSLWAIPTAEVPLTSLARDEILPWESLPLRVMAHTSCFRREAGAAGRDTRGLLRVHEFDKVEILAYCAPEQARSMPTWLPVPRRPYALWACRIACWICVRAIWATPRRARSTWRCTHRGCSVGSRSRRFRGSPTTKPGAQTFVTAAPIRRSTPCTR
jgi:seryl-tRNA synthetase